MDVIVDCSSLIFELSIDQATTRVVLISELLLLSTGSTGSSMHIGSGLAM